MDPLPLPFQLHDPERLRQELADAGLEDVEVETITEATEFRSGEHLWDWLVHSNPIVAEILGELGLTEEQTAVVRDAVIRVGATVLTAPDQHRDRHPMSNAEPLARAFAGWGRDNPANLRELLHPDCELVVPESLPYGGTFRGADAAIAWFTHELWRWFDEFTSTPEDLIDAGDRIVVPVHVQARAKNGRTVDVHNVWIYEFKEGKLTRGRVYADTAVLRDAVARA